MSMRAITSKAWCSIERVAPAMTCKSRDLIYRATSDQLRFSDRDRPSFVLPDADWPTASDGLQPLLAVKRTGAPDPLRPYVPAKSGRRFVGAPNASDNRTVSRSRCASPELAGT
jgi:hypothetical protein